MVDSRVERNTVLLVAAVQFINILDFMMVMPLGPDFSRSLGIPTSHLGYIGGAYTLSAALSGLIGAFFLDRFDRRRALAVALAGLVVSTALGGFATDFETLLAARVLAGAFGGPATSISLAIISDVIPPERRGKALGTVMMAFSFSSVLGVPIGLRLALIAGWRTPFFAVAAAGLVIAIMAIALLPSMRGHIVAGAPRVRVADFVQLLENRTVLISYLMTALAMMGMFILVPNIAAYVQGNLGYPRNYIDLLYFAGGVISLFTMRGVGMLVDRFGAFRIGAFGTFFMSTVIYVGFINYELVAAAFDALTHPLVALIGVFRPTAVGELTGHSGVLLVFVGFMFSSAFRNVSYNTLTTRVPGPRERARFMSLQSSVQHASSAFGAFLSSRILSEGPNHSLVGIDTVAFISIALCLSVPPLLYVVEKRVLLGTRSPSAIACQRGHAPPLRELEFQALADGVWPRKWGTLRREHRFTRKRDKRA